jgi:heme-degrading monooxygenase HmoA
MSEAMEELARQQPGFLGMEHAREAIGITVSYWDTLESIARWKSQADHKVAQQLGRQSWYESYRVRICRVERSYGFPQEHP